MARPKKERIICASPRCRRFAPVGTAELGTVILTLDEYEVLRLHDLEGMTQEQVAEQMRVARTSVTDTLDTAHRKMADALTNARGITVEGGSCRICEIGRGCPYEPGEACPRKHRCGAGCRNGLFMETRKQNKE